MGVSCSRIAHGIPVVGNFENTDEVTLAKAMGGKRFLKTTLEYFRFN